MPVPAVPGHAGCRTPRGGGIPLPPSHLQETTMAQQQSEQQNDSPHGTARQNGPSQAEQQRNRQQQEREQNTGGTLDPQRENPQHRR
ncbi:hypothetical protein C8246_03480 [Paracidovorax avenae]|nr:hypothetical protein C8246_03480 [Paracidovorax avenae]AVT20345.1 hypothetical protein C7Y68_10315 [Paracidovorax avenae]